MTQLLSVVVPVFNTQEYVKKCLESIQNQTYPSLDVVVVDDGSTDISGEICDSFAEKDSRFRVIHQPNRGGMAARKAGLDVAKGQFITFVDSDDWVEPDMYESLMVHADSVDLVISGYMRQNKNGAEKKCAGFFQEGLYAGDDLIQLKKSLLYDFDHNISGPMSASLWSKIFRTEKMRKINHDLKYPISQFQDDVVVFPYIAGCTSVYITNQSFYHWTYRLSSSTNRRYEKTLMDITYAYLEMKQAFQNTDDTLRLSDQLEKWTVEAVLEALERKFGFKEENVPIEYILPAKNLYDKRIVLFGAGKCGIDYYRQLKHYGIPIVKWVATRNTGTRLGASIEAVESISEAEFDVVLLAGIQNTTRKEMREVLLALNVPDEKIVWEQPFAVWD